MEGLLLLRSDRSNGSPFCYLKPFTMSPNRCLPCPRSIHWNRRGGAKRRGGSQVEISPDYSYHLPSLDVGSASRSRCPPQSAYPHIKLDHSRSFAFFASLYIRMRRTRSENKWTINSRPNYFRMIDYPPRMYNAALNASLNKEE